MDRDEKDELMDYLIHQGKCKRKVKWKLFWWQVTVRGSYLFKTVVDVTCASLGILVLSPVFLVCAAVIRLESPGPVIFKQKRIGRDGRPFNFYKFRSMYIDAEQRRQELLKANESKDGVIFKMQKDPRVTRFGRFIRKFSIDELPQLFNVVVGDMSLVGPRPPLPSEVAEYTLEDRKRLTVKPGITCIWQVSGRSDIPFRQQVALDKEYIMSRSLWRDLWILLKTVPAVLTGKGAY
ncbi:MAG TPA: exopolysaccharide biosynthesis polyprenyl glycosylphosphotransferase [Victivallis vadensis]|uniref:sugar transferase n=1 Tax=uncultured Victivallis sp. TaxID=354118 RepID=UPI001D345C68|nr:exopolysaccharide biosynthesis polyprenyl glycosylphosphotransferase [uncultured Victivallis sp.]HJH04665.1 exopolysaccharide biosynthesis polyprenyl glycosylphosphotransferase [Victivallis vadensis]